MRNMDTAPKDGTHILIRTVIKHYVDGRYIDVGSYLVECFWRDGEWAIWCGNENTITTEKVHPLGWVPITVEMI